MQVDSSSAIIFSQEYFRYSRFFVFLLFNMLSRLVITFLPRSKHLLVSLLQSPFAGLLEPRKIKSATVSTVSPSICHELMGLDDIMVRL